LHVSVACDLVIREFENGWAVATDGTARITAAFDLAKAEVKGLIEKEATCKRSSDAEKQFYGLCSLDETDYARKNAKNAPFGAVCDRAGRRWLRKQATITRSAKMWSEDTGLSVKAGDGSVDVCLLEEHAGVVCEVAGGEIIRAVNDYVVGSDDIEGVFAGKTGVVLGNLNVGIESEDAFGG
jgi:hypothetical protein